MVYKGRINIYRNINLGRLAYSGVSWGHVCTVGFIGTTVLELRSLQNIERI
jgi:hypothetical protein